MIEFNGNDIIMTRGDTAVIDTIIYTPCDKIYELEKGDEVYFEIKKDGKIYVQKRFQSDSNGVLVTNLEHIDTAYLSKGEYKYVCTLMAKEGQQKKKQETYCMGAFRIR